MMADLVPAQLALTQILRCVHIMRTPLNAPVALKCAALLGLGELFTAHPAPCAPFEQYRRISAR